MAGTSRSRSTPRASCLPARLLCRRGRRRSAARGARRRDRRREIARRRVAIFRIDDADDPSGPLGYKELAGMGIDGDAIRALLAARGLDRSRIRPP